MTILKPLSWKIGVFCYVILSETKNLVLLFKGGGFLQYCRGRGFFFNFCFASGGIPRLAGFLSVTFVQSYKSIKKNSSKNFSVILSVCWFTKQYGESLHPILSDSFSIFLIVIPKNLTNEKFLVDTFFIQNGILLYNIELIF